jgi:hypothetical protein
VDNGLSPKTSQNCTPELRILTPIFAINEFNYVNREIKLNESRLSQKITPLQTLRAVIRMWTDNNHRSEVL